jgi:hypothetical protein
VEIKEEYLGAEYGVGDFFDVEETFVGRGVYKRGVGAGGGATCGRGDAAAVQAAGGHIPPCIVDRGVDAHLSVKGRGEEKEQSHHRCKELAAVVAFYVQVQKQRQLRVQLFGRYGDMEIRRYDNGFSFKFQNSSFLIHH